MRSDLQSLAAAIGVVLIIAVLCATATVLMGCGTIPTQPRQCPVFADGLGLTQANIDSLSAKNHRMGCPDAL